MLDRKIVVIIPAYNEERFIGSVVLKARKHCDKVIVVDDGSTDATAEIATAAGAIVVRHERNRGKGAALNTGFRKSLEFDPEAVVMLDGDGQHRPEEMAGVLSPVLAGKSDIVIGSRYLERRSAVPVHRVWGHWVFTRLTNLLSGVSATDSQSGFRAFSRRAVERITFASDGFSVESEMQFLARDHQLELLEVPITIGYEDKPKRNVIAHGLLVLNGILRLIGQHRPLLFFGVPGAFLLVAGLLWGLWVVDLYRRFQGLAVGYAMISIVFVILGGMILSTGLTLHSIRGLLLEMLTPKEPDEGKHPDHKAK